MQQARSILVLLALACVCMLAACAPLTSRQSTGDGDCAPCVAFDKSCVASLCARCAGDGACATTCRDSCEAMAQTCFTSCGTR